MGNARIVCPIEKGQIHLGDRKFEKWPAPEGREWEKWFTIDMLPATQLYFAGRIFDTDGVHNEILFNDERIGHLPRTKAKKFEIFNVRIPMGVLTEGDNKLTLQAAYLDEHHKHLDNFLIEKMGVYRKAGSSGDGSTKQPFFNFLGPAMERLEWKPVKVPGFNWAGVKNHWGEAFVFGFFDADDTDMLEGAHIKLGRWAQKNNVPRQQAAIAVYDNAPKKDIPYITTELFKGTRNENQSMTCVVHLRGGQFYPAVTDFWGGDDGINFNDELGKDVRAVLKAYLAPK